MLSLRLPDGSCKSFALGTTGAEMVRALDFPVALAVRLDSEVFDLQCPMERAGEVEVVTRTHEAALELLRHDCAHILAEAVQALYPDARVAFGPPTEDGFYYDFARETPFTPECFAALEEKMHAIIACDSVFTRELWDRDEAHSYFSARGESLKAEHVLTLRDSEFVSIYRQGDWLDLCRGPHGPSTGGVGTAFKLLKVSASLWKGGPRALQRIMGTCWRTEEELQAYLSRVERAERCDHRKLGRGLYHFQEEAAGSVFWHEGGFAIYHACERYMRARLEAASYREVRTPQLLDRSLWERSGHWSKFREHMYTLAEQDDLGEGRKRVFALKPMNCPGHVQIFKQDLVSYKDLPVRLSEFGLVHRNEPSGALHGLMRVRAFTQDDGHIFCSEDQIVSETRAFCRLLHSVYRDFGFEDILVKYSDRPPVRAGSDEIWDKAESALREAASNLDYSVNRGEGAFYGPKLEFVLRDALGREWQCGTWQVDFVLPSRLGAYYIDSNGEKRCPVLLHRAILGSLERFVGILMEHYEGALPFWLSPVQVVVATVTNKSDSYARRCFAELLSLGIRARLDCRAEKIGYKVREHSLRKVPVLMIVGEKESLTESVSLRRFGARALSSGESREVCSLSSALAELSSAARLPLKNSREDLSSSLG